MRTLFLCGREVGYPLNQVLLHSLRQFSDVDVISEFGSGKSIVRRSLKVTLLAFVKMVHHTYDLIFVGFYGHLLMLPFGFIRRSKIIFTPFISTYETLVFDRKTFSERSLIAKIAFWLDKTSCKLADHIIVDTQANAKFFSQSFGVSQDKFSIIYIGSDETQFYPHCDEVTEPVVLFHGAFLPLQGIDIVIEAARILDRKSNIRFRLVGAGIGLSRMKQMVENYALSNVEFLPPVPVNQLPEIISKAMICLGGHFGTSDKAARVIAGKTFQDLAMGKPTIVGDGLANRELLTHGMDAWFCSRGSPQSLADAILILTQNPDLRAQLGKNAQKTFLEYASLSATQIRVRQVIEKIIPVADHDRIR